MYKGKVLIIDDNEDVLFSLNLLLKPHTQAIRVATDPQRIGHFMKVFEPDVILLDMNFTRDAVSGQEGFRYLEQILEIDKDAVVIFMTAYSDTEKAIRAIKAGATDFIPKPRDNDKLLATLKSGMELRMSRFEVTSLKEKIVALGGYGSAEGPILIGESPAMQRIKANIERFAMTDANILVLGENGTGKDVVARLIHQMSQRNENPFVAIDLGTVPEALFESELFGYEKGAFTGAGSAKAGRMDIEDVTDMLKSIIKEDETADKRLTEEKATCDQKVKEAENRLKQLDAYEVVLLKIAQDETELADAVELLEVLKKTQEECRSKEAQADEMSKETGKLEGLLPRYDQIDVIRNRLTVLNDAIRSRVASSKAKLDEFNQVSEEYKAICDMFGINPYLFENYAK